MKKESSQGKIRLVASIKTFSLLQLKMMAITVMVAKFICKFRPKCFTNVQLKWILEVLS